MEPNTNLLATVYTVYAATGVGLTIWLARTLSRNGEVFLEDVFADNPRMAAAVNRLLVVGFYLLNLGYALVTLKASTTAPTTVAAIEILAMKLGALLLSLGVTLSGCGYVWRTLPDGYYPVDTGVKIYRTDKYGNRTGQAYAVEGDKVYQTDQYGNRTGQAYEVKD